MGYEGRLLSGDVPGQTERFFVEDAHLFEPFRTREKEDILYLLIVRCFHLQTYLDSGVITRMFPLHDKEEAKVVRSKWVSGPPTHSSTPARGSGCCSSVHSCAFSWCCCSSRKERGWARTFLCCLCGAGKNDYPKWQPFGSLSAYLTESFHLDHDAISAIRMYNGEQIAMFYAWFCHVTCWLMMISPFGIVLQVYHFSHGVSKSSFVLPMALLIVIWGTLQHKFWKRKQAELAYIW